MTQDGVPFPKLKDHCESLAGVLRTAEQWASQHAKDREGSSRPVTASWRQQLARHLAATETLGRACSLPPAVALYGQTGSGKSTLVGWFLGERLRKTKTALALPEDLRNKLTFLDLNPHKPQEATAVVTRFTVAPPAVALGREGKFELGPLSIPDFLLVLATAFGLECKSDRYWSLKDLQDFAKKDGPQTSQRSEWKSVTAAQITEVIRTLAEEFELPRYSQLSGEMREVTAILRAHEGSLSAIAPSLLWDEWAPFSELWKKAVPVLKVFSGSPQELPLSALPFLIDSSCPEEIGGVKALAPKTGKLLWSQVRKSVPSSFPEDLRILQAVASEAVLGVEGELLSEASLKLASRGDILDIPGLVAVGGGGGTKLLPPDLNADDGRQLYRALRRGKELVLFAKYSREHVLQHVCYLLRFGRTMVAGAARQALRIFGRTLVPPGTDDIIKALYDQAPDAAPPVTLGITFSGAALNELGGGKPDALRLMLNEIAPSNLGDWWNWPSRFRQIHLTRYPHLDANEELQDPEEGGRAFLAEPVVEKHLQNPKREWDGLADNDDCGISALIEDLSRHLNASKRETFLRGQLVEIGVQAEALLAQLFVDSSPAQEAQKRRTFAAEVARDLKNAGDARLVLAAVRNSLKVEEALAVRGRQEAAGAGKVAKRGQSPAGVAWLRTTLEHYCTQMLHRPQDIPLVSSQFLSSDRMIQLARWLSEAAVTTQGDKIHEFFEDFVGRLEGDDRTTFEEIGATWASLALWGRYHKLADHVDAAEARKRIPEMSRGAKKSPARVALDGWLDQLPELLAAGVGDVVAAPSGNDELAEVLRQLRGATGEVREAAR